MIGIVYTDFDPVSKSAGEAILKNNSDDLESWREFSRLGEVAICKVKGSLLEAEHLDTLGLQSIFFLSKHRSEKGVISFTTHALGNWTDKAELGGSPKKLSVAEPIGMLDSLMELKNLSNGVNVVYEATHHGPLLNTPCCFVEFGGPDSAMESKAYSEILGTAAINACNRLVDKKSQFQKIALGIGSTHYPEKFTRLAIENGYAFSHIMPKYSIINNSAQDNLDMIEQAKKTSGIEPEIAVIDWKSMNSELRKGVLKKLEEIGLDYEKI